MKRIILLFSAVISTVLTFAQTEIKNGVVIDKTAQKIVDNIALQIKKDTPFSLNFSYNVKDGKINMQGSGTFLSNNAKYRIITDEFHYYSNGATVWNYIKSANETEVMDVEDGNTMFNFVKIISASLTNYRPKLIRKEVYNKVECNIIDLTPMKGGNVSKIRIYSSVSANRLMKVEIHAYSGGKYIYTFSKYQPNVKITDKDFIYDSAKYPKAKIIDLR